MPSVEEVPEDIMSFSSTNSNWDKQHHWNKCSCCPYGFHIDVEFVQFSKSLLSRPGDVTRIQALKDKWRSERQSMDQLLGGNGVDSRRNSTLEKLNTWNHNSSSNGLYLNLAERVHTELKLITDEEPFDNGLEAAEAEFDLALQRAQASYKDLAYEVDNCQKFHTFPRIKAPFGRKVVNDSPIIPKRDMSQRTSIRGSILVNEDLLSKDHVKPIAKENGSLAREQNNLHELQEKLRVLTRENWKLKCEILTTKDWDEQEMLIRKNIDRVEQQEINELKLATGVPKPTTRDVFVQAIPRTKDIGVSKPLPLTRSIGVGGIGITESIYLERSRREEPSSPTGSFSGTLRRRVRVFDAGVQVNECDLQLEGQFTPLLQIVEKVDVSVQTTEYLVEKKKFKEIGLLAKPSSYDFGMSAKPEVHSVLCGIERATQSVKVQTEPEDQALDLISQKPSGFHTDSTMEPLLSELPSSVGDTVKSFETSLAGDSLSKDSSLSPKLKPKSKLPKSLFEQEKHPSSSESAPKLVSKIPRLSPSLRSPSKQENEWFSQPTSPRNETPSPVERPVLQRSHTYTKETDDSSDKDRSITPRLQKAIPSKEMQGALKVLNDALLRGRTTQNVTSAIGIILHEWFRVSGTKTANPHDVEDYLDNFENYSPQILRYIVNMPDGNGNTAMHYAVSHGNFDVVSILLDSRVCDPNKANKAGYTSVMLVALAKVVSDTHRHVVRRLFSMGDVNTKAAQHGQTALMLAASHGRLDTVKLLLEAGAEINLQDEDGSTALMCASEHGHGEIVRYLLSMPDCNPDLTDNDGSTALSVAMEAGNKDIGVMLYAHMNFPDSPTNSSSRRNRSEEDST